MPAPPNTSGDQAIIVWRRTGHKVRPKKLHGTELAGGIMWDLIRCMTTDEDR